MSRVLILLGFSVGSISWGYTVSHIGDDTYLLLSEFKLGATHAWYHAFREAAGDLSSMIIVLFIFFGPTSARTGFTWLICFILMVGYYAPFWVGMPFLPELSAPNLSAELTHISMALLAVSGLILARRSFL